MNKSRVINQLPHLSYAVIDTELVLRPDWCVIPTDAELEITLVFGTCDGKALYQCSGTEVIQTGTGYYLMQIVWDNTNPDKVILKPLEIVIDEPVGSSNYVYIK